MKFKRHDPVRVLVNEDKNEHYINIHIPHRFKFDCGNGECVIENHKYFPNTWTVSISDIRPWED